MPQCMWQQPQRDCTNVASVGSVQKKKNGVQKEHNSQTTVWRSTYQWRQEIWENACW